MIININAGFVPCIAPAISNEKVRHYLNGFLVESADPLPGVYLVATDGHRLLVAYDESGTCEESAIIEPSKEMLAACKRGKYDLPKRLIISDGKPSVEMGEVTVWASGIDCRIDATYADWRRIIQPIESQVLKDGAEALSPVVNVAFNAKYLADFSKTISAINTNFDVNAKVVSMRIGVNEAVHVRFSGAVPIFGLLMPWRYVEIDDTLPGWLQFNSQA